MTFYGNLATEGRIVQPVEGVINPGGAGRSGLEEPIAGVLLLYPSAALLNIQRQPNVQSVPQQELNQGAEGIPVLGSVAAKSFDLKTIWESGFGDQILRLG